MQIRRATRQDLPAIRHLLTKSGNKMQITEAHLNNRDIAIQARAEDGSLIGFIWCGLMSQNTEGYINLFAVDPAHFRKGVGKALAKAMHQALLKRNVRFVFGIIRHDGFHDASAMNALNMAMGANPEPYTFVCADVLHSTMELKKDLEV